MVVHHSLVYSHLQFGLTVWCSTILSYSFKLQRLQNKAMRIITDIHSPITPKFNNLGILKISELYAHKIAKIMHQHSKPAFLKVGNIASLGAKSERGAKGKQKRLKGGDSS